MSMKSTQFNKGALQHVRYLLPLDVAKMLASSIVGSRLDYCNSLMYGAPNSITVKVKTCSKHTCLSRPSTTETNACQTVRYELFTGCQSSNACSTNLLY
jgi:hypothetical protein